jgi:hypothetical protein
MKRIATILVGLLAALGVGGVVAASLGHAGTDQRPTASIHAQWDFHPTTLAQARNRAQSIVLVRVVSVAAGPDIVTREPGEPDGVDRIPTQRITLTVLRSFKGAAATGAQLTLFQTGGTVSTAKAGDNHPRLVLDGDPFYTAGEQYLLMLVAGPQGTQRVVAPEGRFRYDTATGALAPMVAGPVADQVNGKRLPDLQATLTS